MRCERGGQPPDMGNGFARLINSADPVSTPQEIEKIPATPAAGIEHLHLRSEAALQELVEQVDVYLPEPLL